MHSPSFLVLRGGAIGDFIVTVPAMQALRQRWPASRIEMAGYPHICALAAAAGVADTTLSLDRPDFARLFAAGAPPDPAFCDYVQGFDVVISYLFDPDGIACDGLRRAGARHLIYCNPVVQEGHAIDHLFAPLVELAIFGSPTARPRLRLEAPVGPAAGGRDRIVLHPGSGGEIKNWPIERYLELIEQLRAEGHSIVVTLGEADAALRAPLTDAGVSDLVTDLSLVELAQLLGGAKAYVGNDSGVTHIAAAVGCPTVAVFGPTDPAQWAPRGGHVRVVAAAERKPEAMRAVSVDGVRQALQDLLRIRESI